MEKTAMENPMSPNVEKGRSGLHRALRHILTDEENVMLMESSPLIFMHLMLFALPFTGFSWIALAVCMVTYAVRVFALTGGYHRYFSHKSYKTSRVFQFLLAFLGASSGQLGPVWWAAHHRHHHQYSDQPEDIHSPPMKGFLWSHIGWLLCQKFGAVRKERVGDLLKFPEIRWIDRFHVVPVLVLALSMYGLGAWLEGVAPGLGTNGWQMLMYGFFLSTVMVYHVTFCINSVTHIIGKQRFNTGDQSRNSLLMALLTFGEGWHNNHHRYPVSARQGFYWWEVDATYYVLKILEKLHVVWDIKAPPRKVYQEAEERRQPSPAG